MLTDHAVEALTDSECLDLLQESRVGRVAVSVAALPAIYPVDYRFVDGDIVFLAGTASGARAALEGSVVAFEVDQLDPDGGTGWSVLAVGLARVATDEEAGSLRAVTGPSGVDTPRLIKVHPEFLSGRRIAQVIVPN